MSPLDGSSFLYNRVIRPYFLKHEAKIDDFVKKGQKLAVSAVEKGMEKGKQRTVVSVTHDQVKIYASLMNFWAPIPNPN